MSLYEFDKPEIITTALGCYYSFEESVIIGGVISEKDEIRSLTIIHEVSLSKAPIIDIAKAIKILNEDLVIKKKLKRDYNNFEEVFLNKHFALKKYLRNIGYSENELTEIDFNDLEKNESEPTKDLYLSLVADRSFEISEGVDLNRHIDGATLKAIKLLVRGLADTLIPTTKTMDYYALGELVTEMVNTSINNIRNLNTW
jgi:hypothetical protein